MSYEDGINTKTPRTTLCKNKRFNKMAEKAKRGEQVEEFEATPEMLAWFKGFKQTYQETEEYTPIFGWITSSKFQTMFNVTREATLPDV